MSTRGKGGGGEGEREWSQRRQRRKGGRKTKEITEEGFQLRFFRKERQPQRKTKSLLTITKSQRNPRLPLSKKKSFSFSPNRNL